jgi:uncharacterized protein YutE (UPF0331/DUF86 family)
VLCGPESDFRDITRIHLIIVILHASIIEGAVRNESNKDGFKQANKSLKDAGIISPAEFNAFEEVRELRNKLIHESFEDGLDEDQILGTA